MCHLAAATLTAAETVDFDLHVRPILESTCVGCHGPEHDKGKFRLTTKAEAFKGGDRGVAIVPGKPSESSLYTFTVLPKDHDDIMPPKGDLLTKSQSEILRVWIEQGAAWPENAVLKQARRAEFTKEIKPILEFNCVACHREGHSKGGLRLDEKDLAFKGGESGKPGIVPFKPKDSTIYTSTKLSVDDDALMPPKAKGGPLPNEKIEMLLNWIEQGAPWPEGVKLEPKKLEIAAGVNEKDLIAQIHTQISSKANPSQPSEMKAYTNFIPGTKIKYAMVPIPAGEFVMGSPASEKGRKPDEGPQFKTSISPFWMGQHEVTWNEFELFMYPDEERKFKTEIATDATIDKISDGVTRPTKPYVEMSFGMGKDGFPAISMTQHAANKYCEWLSAKTGHYYRLPTEAEWEYACRAGTATAYSFGDDASAIGDYAWYEKNSDFKYQRVGKKLPNPWGLYDMHGNVAEWCLDQYLPTFDKLELLGADPWNKADKPYPHVVKGGSWDDTPDKLRSAARRASNKSWKQQDPQLPKSVWYHTDAQFLGFRIIRPLKIPTPEAMQGMWNSGVEKD